MIQAFGHILREHFKRWLAVFVGLVTFVATVIELDAVRLTPVLIGIFLLASVLVSSIIVYLTIGRAHSNQEVLPPEDDKKKVAVLRFPITRELAAEATTLGRGIFGGEDVGLDVFEQWRAKNSLITTCLSDHDSRFVGYFTILPLRSQFANRFFHEGNLGSEFEKAITPDDILDEMEMRRARHLYISGIAVKDPLSLAGKRHAAVLLWAAVEYVSRYYDINLRKNLYAVPTTKDGAAIVRRLGFKLVREGFAASGRHDLYAIRITKDSAQRLRDSLLKVQHCCDFSSYEKYLKKVGKSRVTIR